LGKFPAHKLFDLIRVDRRDPQVLSRRFGDYEVSVPEPKDLPAGVSINILEG